MTPEVTPEITPEVSIDEPDKLRCSSSSIRTCRKRVSSLVPQKCCLQREANRARSASLRTSPGMKPVIYIQRASSRRVRRSVEVPRSIKRSGFWVQRLRSDGRPRSRSFAIADKSLKDDDASRIPSLLEVLERLRRVLDAVASRDQLVQLQLS